MSHINILYRPYNTILTFRTFDFGLIKCQVEKKQSYSYDFCHTHKSNCCHKCKTLSLVVMFLMCGYTLKVARF